MAAEGRTFGLKSTTVTARRVADFKLEFTGDRGHKLLADAGPDMGGKAEGFSPTELLLSALGACMSQVLLYYAKNHAYPLEDITLRLTDQVAPAPLRIERIKVDIGLEGDLSQEQRDRLLLILRRACKIGNTLANSPQVDIEIRSSTSLRG